MFIPSNHARTRNAQRNLRESDLAYVVANGQEYHKAGAIIYYLRSCDVAEKDLKSNQYARLIGTAVITSKDDGTEITAWRNRKTGLKIIKQKPVGNRLGRKEVYATGS